MNDNFENYRNKFFVTKPKLFIEFIEIIILFRVSFSQDFIFIIKLKVILSDTQLIEGHVRYPSVPIKTLPDQIWIRHPCFVFEKLIILIFSFPKKMPCVILAWETIEKLCSKDEYFLIRLRFQGYSQKIKGQFKLRWLSFISFMEISFFLYMFISFSLIFTHSIILSPFTFYPFILLSIYLFIYASIHTFVYLSIYLLIYSYFCLFVYLFTHLFIYSSIQLFIYSSIHLFIYSPILIFI